LSTYELTELIELERLGKERLLIGQADPSPFPTAPNGLVLKKLNRRATSSCVKGPNILPLINSLQKESLIFGRASKEDEWLGGVN
jgi:hypothetical protein